MQDRLIVVGKKVGMTQMFDADNHIMPVTAIEVEPCVVSQIKTVDHDGYNAVQFAYFKRNHITKPIEGHLAKANIQDKFGYFCEFTTDETSNFTIGNTLSLDLFQVGQLVDVVAQSKGKGFQGVVRRFGFGGGRATHGSMSHRRGGSYGHFRRMGHVIKNQKMPGHMGSTRITVHNLSIVGLMPEKRILVVRGSVPGANGNWVMIRKAKSVIK